MMWCAGSPRSYHSSQVNSRLNPSAPTYTPWGSTRTSTESDTNIAVHRGASGPGNTSAAHAGGYNSRQDVRSNSYGGEDYSSSYYGSAMGYGKTPKRPSALTTGGGASRPGYHSAGGVIGSSGRPEDVISPEQAGHLSVSPPESQGARRPASTGAGSAPGSGSGPGFAKDTPALVSSEDPMMSPTRFVRRDRPR